MQDIEAEDHILGPLTLRQFIFALVAVFLFYINFVIVTKGAAFLLIVFLPPALFCGFFALPFGRDQPTEVWALAKLRFWFRPRQRVWSQDGVKELVTITVPKKVEPILTDGLSQREVKSRLEALASTIDTRGWAVKNVTSNTYTSPLFGGGTSDRLLDIGNAPPDVPTYEVRPGDDMLDSNTSPIAQQFDAMISQSNEAHRQQLISQMNSPTPSPAAAAPAQPRPAADQPAPDYWFMGPGGGTNAPTTIEAPQAASIPAADEAALTAELKSHSTAKPTPYGHLRTVQPLGSQPAAPPAPQAPAAPPPTDPALLSLATNDDLDVATLAREAKKAKGDDEVTISLR